MNPEIGGSPRAVSALGAKHTLSRRELLALSGSLAAAYFIGGCGGGGNGGGGSIGGGGLDRTVVTGDIKNQLNLFSLASEQMGNLWEGSSDALTNFKTFANGGLRSPAETRVMFQATWYSLHGLKSGYERLLNGYLAGDDQGYVSQTVSTKNSLSDSSTLVNPQWLAAMMLQTHCSTSLIGALIRIVQIGGIKPMQDWVKTQPSDLEKLIAYGILADTYNSWLDAIAASIGNPPVTALKLDVSNTATAAQVAANVDGIDAKIAGIPFSPGLRGGGNANGIPDDAMLTGPETANFALSFLGTLAKITLTTGAVPATFPQTVDPTTAGYNLAARLGNTGLAGNITALDSTSAAQTKATALVRQLMDTGLPGADGSAADCHRQIAVGAYGVVVAVAQAVLSEHSIIGAALDGNNAIGLLDEEINAIHICGSAAQNAILDSVNDCTAYLHRTNLIGGNVVTLRSVQTVNITDGVETDLIRGMLQISAQNQFFYPPANAGWNVSIKSGTIGLFRGVAAGLPASPTGVARTFNNVEVAMAGLFYDLLTRFSDSLRPDLLTDGRMLFITADFARLLRRSPGATFAKIPNITSAALLCSAPEYVPSKTNPVNLSTLASMGPLAKITDLVSGVPVNVS